MNKVEIPDEAYIVAVGQMGWDLSAPLFPLLEKALEAAAPLIVAAAFERMAHDVDSTGTSEDGEFHKGFKSGQRWFKNILRDHAELLRGES